MDHYIALTIGVLVVGIFVAATGVVGAFLCYAAAQEATDYSADHLFKPAVYQPMKMLTQRPAVAPETPESHAVSADVAAAA